jgi:hypothetical protein
MQERFNAAIAQPGRSALEQEHILKRSSAQADMVRVFALSQAAAHSHHGGSQGVVEPGSDFICCLPRLPEVANNALDGGPHVDLPQLAAIALAHKRALREGKRAQRRSRLPTDKASIAPVVKTVNGRTKWISWFDGCWTHAWKNCPSSSLNPAWPKLAEESV